MQISFTVEGQPRGKGRPRFSRTGHAYTDQATKAYEHKVLQAWQEQSGVMMADVPLAVLITAFFKPPESTPKKRMAEVLASPHTKKPDADNVVKAILDGINGHAFKDDNQISSLVVTKCYSQRPRVEVVIWPDERAGYTAQTIADMEVE